MGELIKRRIHELLAGGDPRFEWVRRGVREHGFLPLHLGWVVVIGIRPDGEFVEWRPDEAPEVFRPHTDPYWRRVTLCEGAKKYPELAAIIPARPAEARDCRTCGGTGRIAAAPQLTCPCGGLGWLLPGEPPGTG